MMTVTCEASVELGQMQSLVLPSFGKREGERMRARERRGGGECLKTELSRRGDYENGYLTQQASPKHMVATNAV